MSDRVKFIVQKRKSLKSQITNLGNALDKGNLDNTTLKLRLTRLSELYRAYEEFNDELAILDSDEGHQTEFENIQERFYGVAGKIESILNATNTSNVTNTSNAEADRAGIDSRDDINTVMTSNKTRRIKLPEAALPTFDGRYECWLSFKNAFHNMIGSRADLSDIDKLHYLKTALIDQAASKIRIFEIDGINYSKA